MSFYDSVKEHVRDENADQKPDEPADTGQAEGDGVFDELRKGAEEPDADDQPQDDDAADGSDTDIEVLTEDGLKPADTDGKPVEQPQEQGPADTATAAASQDDVVALLETIEEQNREMLAVLRRIDQSLQ